MVKLQTSAHLTVKYVKETPVFGRNEGLSAPAIILEHLDFVTENEYPPKNLP